MHLLFIIQRQTHLKSAGKVAIGEVAFGAAAIDAAEKGITKKGAAADLL
jgi:hypothetical protein